jgi:DNA-binding ferritin-like protein
VKGEKADEIKEKVLNFDRKLSGEVKVYSESPKVANILESTDRNLHSRSRNCSVNNEMTRTNGQSYSTNTNDANYNKSPEFYEINSKFENYSQNVTRKLDALAEEISTIKENKENAAYGILILEETVNDVKKEKYELNRENEELKEKNKNLFQSLSEVRAKVIELQDEKLSLITALKLIQRESVLLAEKRKLKTRNLRTRI